MFAERASCLSCTSPCSTDSCATNTPGGLLLLTSFWDYSPATGPSDSWTIHGLWPDNCDGTYEASCDSSRSGSQISQVLQMSAPSTLDYMNEYWVDVNGDNAQFWKHEYEKHATCISTLKPACYANYTSGQDIVDFFTVSTELFQQYNLYSALSSAGITPSSSETYTLAALQSAAKASFGGITPSFRCTNNVNLKEAWFDFETTGRSTTVDAFTLVDPIASNTNCATTGIKYNPKSG
ncbi:hypothetical protein CBS101457_004737 [Exobasidium rhododendri]|nr:hypothetical protein CBS101457_004737 [Exobasidium rhododendri]